jgi:hypothetical protein
MNLAHHISRFTNEAFELQLLMEETDTTAGFDWGISRCTYEYTDVSSTGKMIFQKVTKVYK